MWGRGVHAWLSGTLGNGSHTFRISSLRAVQCGAAGLSHQSCAARRGGGRWIMQTQWAKANISSETKDTPLRSQGGQLFPLSEGSVLN